MIKAIREAGLHARAAEHLLRADQGVGRARAAATEPDDQRSKVLENNLATA